MQNNSSTRRLFIPTLRRDPFTTPFVSVAAFGLQHDGLLAPVTQASAKFMPAKGWQGPEPLYMNLVHVADFKAQRHLEQCYLGVATCSDHEKRQSIDF